MGVEEDDEEEKITDKESSQVSISKFPDHVLVVWAKLDIDTEWTSEEVLANVQKFIDKKNTEYAKKNEKEIEKIKKKLPTLQKELAKLWNLLTKLQQEMEETDKRIKKHEKKAKTLRNTAIALVVAFSVFIGYKAITTESSNQIIEISKSTPESTVPDTTTTADGQELLAETAETNTQDSTNDDIGFWEDLVEEIGEGELNTEQILAEKKKLEEEGKKLDISIKTKNAVNAEKYEMVIKEKQETKQIDNEINALTYLKKLLNEGTPYDEAMKQTQKKFPNVDIVKLCKQE